MTQDVRWAGRPARDPDELVLYEALRRGSTRAHRRLVELHHPTMLRVAGWYAPEPAAARRLVREAWGIALDGLNMFTWHTTFRAWLFGILVSVGRSLPPPPDPLPAPRTPHPEPGGTAPPGAPATPPADWTRLPWTAAWTADSWQALEEGLAALGRAEREVVALHDVEGWPEREVLDALGHPQAQGRELLAAGRRHLVDAVRDHLGLPADPAPGEDQVAGVREALALLGTRGPDPTQDPALAAAFRAWRSRRGLRPWHRLPHPRPRHA